MWLAEWAAGVAGDSAFPSMVVAVAAAVENVRDSVPTSTIVAGLIALASAALAAWLGARGTLRTADVQREQAFDKRTDERLSKADEERDKAYQEREAAIKEMHRYREQYAGLRVAVIEAGFDPDNMPRKGAARDPT